MQLRRLVLPAPLGPMIARISPGYTSKLTSTSAAVPPKLRLTSRACSKASIASPFGDRRIRPDLDGRLRHGFGPDYRPARQPDSLFEQRAAHNQSLNLAGPLVNLEYLGVAHQLLNREFA